MWFPPEQMVWYAHPGRVVVSLGGIEGWPELTWAAARCSLSINFDGSRTSQVHAELVLQFSALSSWCLGREKRREKKRPLFSWLVWQPAAGPQCPGFWGCYVLYEGNQKVNYCTLFSLSVLVVSFLAKKLDYLVLATTDLKYTFRLMRAQSSRAYQLSTILVSPT
jgi:hypothetical protein